MTLQPARHDHPDGEPPVSATPAATMPVRRAERSRVAGLLRAAADGRAGVLRVIGERGAGKTTVLDDAAAHAAGFRVLRVRAVAAERDLPYAGLHVLCAPLSDDIRGLPAADRDVLAAAVGSTTGRVPDRFAVGLAALNLLSGMAATEPVCLIIDDAHLLDPASARLIAFVARRVDRNALLILLAEHGPRRLAELDDLPEMCLRPLSRAEAHTLITASAPGRIDDMVMERVLAETRGNPRAIAESFDGLTADELAGGFAVPVPRGGMRCAPGHDCPERARRLSTAGRRLLLTAAADLTGDPSLIWRTAARLDVTPDTADELETRNLLVFDGRTVFACPALRSVVYSSATPGERRQIHRALAEATEADPVRRSWHLALAATGLDDALADTLERCALPAQSRGGVPARAAFLDRATLLTGDVARRADRALAAAAAKLDADAPEAAQRLLAIAETGPHDPARLAHASWHRARLDIPAGGGAATARRLLHAACRLGPHAPEAAREAHLQALLAAMSAGHSAGGLADIAADVARSALAAAAGPPRHPIDLLLRALATRMLDGYPPAVVPLARAIRPFREDELDPRVARWLDLAGGIAADLWDDRAWMGLAARSSQPVTGADPAASIGARTYPALAELYRGRMDEARARLSRAVGRASAGVTGTAPTAHPWLLLSAWQGETPMLDGPLPQVSGDPRGDGDAVAMTGAGLASAVLLNGLGHYDRAIEAARDAAESDQLGMTGWALTELVEAAARGGRLEVAERAAARLARRTSAAGTDWALGSQSMAWALVADEGAAEPMYREAVERLARTEIRPQAARARLLYGEWLRRRNRRIDARTQLRAAGDLFVAMGARVFADRTQRELLATGESARKRTAGTERQLTPQERRIACLARDGLSNPDIGARLFVSPRTVEYHLHKVFAKLAISSRTQLHLVLSDR